MTLGVRTPERGADSRRRGKRAGTPRRATNPKTGGRAPTSKLDRPPVFFNLDSDDCVSEVSLWRSPTACRRSVGQVALLPQCCFGFLPVLSRVVASVLVLSAVASVFVLSSPVLASPAVSLFGLCGFLVSPAISDTSSQPTCGQEPMPGRMRISCHVFMMVYSCGPSFSSRLSWRQGSRCTLIG